MYGSAAAWPVKESGNTVTLDPYRGQALRIKRAEELGAFDRWSVTSAPLHFGDFGGIPTKTLWSLFGMMLPAMTLTGAYLSLRQSGVSTPKIYRVAAILSAAVFCWSLYACLPAITRYSTPSTPAFHEQPGVNAGPWRFEIAAAGNTLRVRPVCSGCVAVGTCPYRRTGETRQYEAERRILAR